MTINGTLSHSGNKTTEQYKLNLTTTNDLTLGSNGSIDVSAQGFLSSEGPGQGTDNTTGASGASHGGLGGAGAATSTVAATYGDNTAPITLGSGGGADGAGYGGIGGGAVRVTVGGTAAINGTINANGQNYLANESGGGSGGSVYITASALTGTGGAITANGGNGYSTYGGGGGGGRIALISGSISANWAQLSVKGGLGYAGGVSGTLYPSGLPTVSTQAVTDLAPSSATGNGSLDTLGLLSVAQHGHVWSSTDATPVLANPTAHWKLNESNINTNVYDAVGAYNGTAQRNTSTIATSGKLISALNFNGTSDFVSLPAGCLVSNTWTIAFWVNPNTPTDNARIFLQGASGCPTRQAMAYWRSGHIEIVTATNGASTDPQLATSAITSGVWSQVIWTFDGSTHKLYVNGVESTAATIATGMGVDGNNYIGARTGSQNYFTGKLDDMRVYNSVLSAAQISLLYNSGNGTEAALNNYSYNQLGAKSSAGAFTSPITDLQRRTTYYARAYVIASDNTVSYGDVVSFTPPNTLTKIYYSVGQSSADLKTGSPTMTISSGVATFSVAQTGNIGVGDRITYNTNSIAYIAGKRSETEWDVITVQGDPASNVSNQTVNSIRREYTSLASAIAGALDANHLGTADLVTNNYILHFPCYYDTGADTTAVTIDSYTTGANNYIKIYTPNNTSTEANQSQRHSGRWNTGKYALRASVHYDAILDIRDEYVRVEGLQIEQTGAWADVGDGVNLNNIDNVNSDIQLSNLIIRDTGGASNNGTGLRINSSGSRVKKVKVWNTLVYDYYNGIITSNFGGGSEISLANVSVMDSLYRGIQGVSYPATQAVFNIKNCLVQGLGTSSNYIFDFTNTTATYTANLSEDATSPNSTLRNKVVTFVDEANDNFHLAANDTAAVGAGVNLMADAYLSETMDIDAEPRPNGDGWEVGADEMMIAEVEMGGAADTSADPVAYYKFDEGYGDTAHNDGSAGSSANGTLNSGASGGNATTTAMWDKNGKYGGAMEFDGSNDYMNFGNSSIFNFSNNFTLSTWVRRSNSSELVSLMERGLDGNSGYAFAIGMHSCAVNQINFSKYYINHFCLGTLPTDTSWHHIIVTVSSSAGIVAYVDGQLSGSNPDINNIRSYNGDLLMGNSGNGAISDYMDEVRVYDYVLTADQVKREFDSGAAMVMGGSGTDSSGNGTTSANREYCVPGDTTACAAPVGEWKMDEKVSGNNQTIYDTSGSGNNGTTNWGANSSGMDCSKPGKYGSGCEFDGVDDHIMRGSDIFSGMTSFTFSAWIKRNSTSQGYVFYGVDRPYLYVDATWARFKTNNTNVDASVSLSTGQWYHLDATFDGTTSKIYINGVMKASGSDSLGSHSNFILGSDGVSGTNRFNGTIDQVRVYNYARSAEQIAWEYNHGQPIAHWSFNECTGNTVHNEMANANHGTISLGASGQTATGSCTANANTPWYNGRTGKFGGSMNFDGTDDSVTITNDASSMGFTTSKGSVSGWFKADSVADNRYIFYHRTGTDNNRLFLYVRGGQDDFYCGYGMDLYAAGNDNNVENDGRWHFATMTWNNNNMTCYLDGKSIGTYNGALSGNNGQINLGSAVAGGYFDGQLDDIRMFQYPLTEDQIQQVMNEGAGIKF